jgi:hypothetical protein
LNDATLKERVAVVTNERDVAQIAFDRALAETRHKARITHLRLMGAEHHALFAEARPRRRRLPSW